MKKPTNPTPKYVIENNTFKGVEWDGKAIDAINTLAEALLEQARATSNFIKLFNSQNITIDAMIKLDSIDPED